MSNELKGTEVTLPSFTGERNVLILCEGDVDVYRSIDGGTNFYPYTDEAGTAITLTPNEGTDLVFNSSIVSNSPSELFKLSSDVHTITAVVKL